MLARKAATAVALAEFFTTHSDSPAAERVHFSADGQDLDARRMLTRSPVCGHQGKPRLKLGINACLRIEHGAAEVASTSTEDHKSFGTGELEEAVIRLSQ